MELRSAYCIAGFMQCDLRSDQPPIEGVFGAQGLGQIGGLTETMAFFGEQVIFHR